MAIILNEACKRGRFDLVAATPPLPQSQWHRCGEFRGEIAPGLAESGCHRAMPSVAARETAGHLATPGGSRSAASLVAGRSPRTSRDARRIISSASGFASFMYDAPNASGINIHCRYTKRNYGVILPAL